MIRAGKAVHRFWVSAALGWEGLLSGSESRKQAWTLDLVGNWPTFKVDPDGQSGWTTQTRDHNKANELEKIDDVSTHLAHDARGNMTKAPVPDDEANHHYNCTYDAWNRLVKVQDDQGTPVTIAEYRYDGLGQRIAKLIPNGENWDRTDLYYNAGWQALEERFAENQADPDVVATNLKVQWVWSARYIDAPVLRDRDTTGNQELDERLYYTTDANMNVTALVNTSGTVQERYTYDPYGKVTIRHPTTWVEITWNASKKNEILYCGYRYDNETGLYQVRHRYYHPTLGRWVTRDPIGYVDGMSVYQYAKGNPVKETDARGLSTGRKHGAQLKVTRLEWTGSAEAIGHAWLPNLWLYANPWNWSAAPPWSPYVSYSTLELITPTQFVAELKVDIWKPFWFNGYEFQICGQRRWKVEILNVCCESNLLRVESKWSQRISSTWGLPSSVDGASRFDAMGRSRPKVPASMVHEVHKGLPKELDPPADLGFAFFIPDRSGRLNMQNTLTISVECVEGQ